MTAWSVGVLEHQGHPEFLLRAFLISFCIFFKQKQICICKCFSRLRPLRKTALPETEMT